MQHVDRGTAALLALGEEVDDGERGHVRACPECESAVAVVRADLFRLNDPDSPAPPPPASVWEGILRRLDIDGRSAP